MKSIVLLVLVAAMTLFAPGLSSTVWIQVPDTESSPPIKCPIQLHFDETKYRYLNECFDRGRNKVVEFGNYSESQSGIWLVNRRVVVGGSSIFGEDAQNTLLESFSVEGSRFSFWIGDSRFVFTRQ